MKKVLERERRQMSEMSVLWGAGATDGSLRERGIMVDMQEFLSLATIALKPLNLSPGLILQVQI